MAKLESIRFYGTGTKGMVNLPTNSQEVSMYTCGPTVYKDAHIGNMRVYMTADLAPHDSRVYPWIVKKSI